jgi:replication factor A2
MSLTAMTIKQLLNAVPIEDGFTVDGVTIHTVRLVGTVEMIDLHSTHAVYTINDNSSSIICKQWNDKDPSLNSKLGQLALGSMVCVIGMLKEYEAKKSVQIVHMRPITDWNERTHHFLEAMLVHLQNTRPAPGVKQEYAHSFGTPMAGLHDNRGPAPGSAIMVEGVAILPHKNPEVTKLFTVILKQFQGMFDESGINKREMLANLSRQGNQVNTANFSEAIKTLADQGYLYSTLDEETYACSINMN